MRGSLKGPAPEQTEPPNTSIRKASPRQTSPQINWLPPQVEIEVRKRTVDRRPFHIVKHNQPTRPHKLPQEVQINEHLVKAMTPINECRIRHKALSQ